MPTKPSTICFFAGLILLAMSSAPAADEMNPTAKFDPQTGRMVLANGRLELVVETKTGINPCSLRDLKSGRVYADGDYSWTPGPRPELIGEPKISEKDGVVSATFKGKSGPLEIELAYACSAGEPDVIVETVRLHNPNNTVLETPAFACGFTKKISDGKTWLPGVADSRFCDVPYRRHPETGELCDYTVPELATKKNWFSTVRSAIYNRKDTTLFGSDGWAWYGGGNVLLLSKYNPDSMEWSLLEALPNGPPVGKEQVLRFGGAGRWKLGDPEGAARLAPEASSTFGTTRYQALDGDWQPAYAAYRRFMETKGHRIPPKFDPPVHWNELYDNTLWWLADAAGLTPENLKKYYQKKDMEIEADKARELGCQCLYLDPGWDTSFGSNIWGVDRLGTQESFVRWLKEKYNFPLALHTPLAPWTDPVSYPPEARRKDKDGKPLPECCCASKAYRENKIARLKELCKNGAYFLMYDGSWFEPCWDPTHGHSVPLTHQEHLDAILKIQQEVHKDCPNVLIEQHDPMVGPGTVRYTPTYFMHAKPGAFDELWGYEYMIETIGDIVSRRAVSLYYVNLAYNIPVYLHIDLRKDNLETLGFWWFASTCRHLGVGGKHADPKVWEAHKKAMQAYLPLKRFYTQGVFYGLDETVHAHTLPDLGRCVMNCFNLEDAPVEKEVRFRPADVGLPAGEVKIDGAESAKNGDQIVLKILLPARGHRLVKINKLEKENP